MACLLVGDVRRKIGTIAPTVNQCSVYLIYRPATTRHGAAGVGLRAFFDTANMYAFGTSEEILGRALGVLVLIGINSGLLSVGQAGGTKPA
jgi:hypothetical protein